MDSICATCALAGHIHQNLENQGYIGCRKVLQIIQESIPLSGYSPYHNMSTEDISKHILRNITCETAAVGWVDNGPLKCPSGIKFNDILITKGTTKCSYYTPEEK